MENGFRACTVFSVLEYFSKEVDMWGKERGNKSVEDWHGKYYFEIFQEYETLLDIFS